jgi:ankyrin repeat protein
VKHFYNFAPPDHCTSFVTSSSSEPYDETMSIKSFIANGEFSKVERALADDGDASAGEVGEYNLFSQKSRGYPLHYLCRTREAPLSTMKAMIAASPPKAFVYRDSVGQSTPLHLAIWYALPVDVIQPLLKASVEALWIQDIDGNLPIHLASALHPEADRLVPALLALQPRTASRRNGKSQTALHNLCTRTDIPIKVLKELIRTDPQPASFQDRMGRLPLHHACLHQADVAVMECLVQAYPPGVNLSDHSASTPYGIVRRRWHWDCTDVRVRLLRKDMIQSSSFPVAMRNKIQFKLEDLSSRKRCIVRPVVVEP